MQLCVPARLVPFMLSAIISASSFLLLLWQLFGAEAKFLLLFLQFLPNTERILVWTILTS
jgi:hypothetical protein